MTSSIQNLSEYFGSQIPMDLAYSADTIYAPDSMPVGIKNSRGKTVVIVGVADDGPAWLPILVRDSLQAERRFGGVLYERISLASGATSASIARAADNDVVELFTETGDELAPYYIDNLTASGTALTFSSPGVATNVVAKYIPSDTGYASNRLVRALNEALLVSDADVYGLRLGGEFATTTIDSIFTIRGIYTGSIYNSCTVTISGNTCSLAQPPGRGGTASFTFSTLQDLVRAINLEATYNKVCMVASTSEPFTTSLTNGTYTLSGGTSGTFDETNLRQAFDVINSLDTEVVVPAGATDVTWYSLIYELVQNFEYPTLVVLAGPDPGTSSTTSYIMQLSNYT